jgi:CRP-like cAMP-binding protein
MLLLVAEFFFSKFSVMSPNSSSVQVLRDSRFISLSRDAIYVMSDHQLLFIIGGTIISFATVVITQRRKSTQNFTDALPQQDSVCITLSSPILQRSLE